MQLITGSLRYYTISLILVCCLAMFSVVQATINCRFFNPNVHPQNYDVPQRKLPELRRKLPIFPKSQKKLVVSPEPYDKAVTFNSRITLETKKPLMRKFVFHEISYARKMPEIKNIERPIMTINTKIVNNNDRNVFKKPESDVLSTEIVEEKRSKESYEISIDKYEDPNPMRKDYLNHKLATASSVHHLKDFIFSPKPSKIIFENNDVIRLPDEFVISKKSEEGDNLADVKEFIFINPFEKNKFSSGDTEEFITTEEAPKTLRRKRSNNVIEEENTTVSGYKYTWRDTRLNNDLFFKNINS